MASFDPEQLLQPVSATDRVGPNLEQDRDYLAVERLAKGEREGWDAGRNQPVPAVPPNYPAARDAAVKLLQRSKDLRVAAVLHRALLHAEGFTGYGAGLLVIRGLIERFWADVHPNPPPDDADVVVMRAGAVEELAAPNVVSALKNLPVLQTRAYGPVALKDLVLLGSGSGGGETSGVDMAALEAGVRSASPAEAERQRLAVETALTHLEAIASAFENASGGTRPDLQPTVRVLRQLRNLLSERFGKSAADGAAAASGPAAADAQAPVAPPPPVHDGKVRSREEVVTMLDKICEYYQSYEPSSPLPLLLRRAQELVGLSFGEILASLAPGSSAQLELVAGKKR